MQTIDWQYEDLHFAAHELDNTKVLVTSSAICNGLGLTRHRLAVLHTQFGDGLLPLTDDLAALQQGAKHRLFPLEYGLSIALGAHRIFGAGNASDDDPRIAERATLRMMENATKTRLSAGEWAVALRRVGEADAVLRTVHKIRHEISLDIFKVPHLLYPDR